jgi:hypothetical protein
VNFNQTIPSLHPLTPDEFIAAANAARKTRMRGAKEEEREAIVSRHPLGIRFDEKHRQCIDSLCPSVFL